jgi:hypothetical protein
MKEFVRRALIVAWLAIAAIFIASLFLMPKNPNTWFIPAALALPVWALQFIALGIVNPARLFRAS